MTRLRTVALSVGMVGAFIACSYNDPTAAPNTVPDTIYVGTLPTPTSTTVAATQPVTTVVAPTTHAPTTTAAPTTLRQPQPHTTAPRRTTTVKPIAGRCTSYEGLLARYAPAGGWSVQKMSRTMFRESNCQPAVRSRTRDTGLLQINDINLPYLSRVFGFTVTASSLKNPPVNIRAAAALCTYWRNNGGGCYTPWNGGA